jgi:hypothetical protein
MGKGMNDIEKALLEELAENGTDKARELFLQWQEEKIKAKERLIAKLEQVTQIQEGEQKIPTWYTEREMYDWLINNKYSDTIARELAPMLSKQYSSAFRKGWQMGQDALKLDGGVYKPIN